MRVLLSLICLWQLAASQDLTADNEIFTGSDDDAYAMPLLMLTAEEAQDGLCLDGSLPGMYFQKANSTENENNWVLYFKGGGWCYDEASCAKRANSSLGSSKYFSKTFGFAEGPVSGDPELNPHFAGFNRVILWYCDGASFSGGRTEPYNYNGQLLYFRGRHVLDAMLRTLKASHGLDKAENVIISGGSAGGLSTFLHADYVANAVKPAKTKAIPVSGFFLLHDTEEGVPQYPNELQYVYNMQNSSQGVNSACAKAMAGPDAWRCIFANYSYAYTSTPIFPLNSALDSWQMGNVFVRPSSWASCVGNHFAKCNATQIAGLNAYAADFYNDLARPATYTKAGNGAFIDLCLEHCAAQGSGWSKYEINGISMRDAVYKWWVSDNEPSHQHTYLPGCQLSTTAPVQCMASCMA